MRVAAALLTGALLTAMLLAGCGAEEAPWEVAGLRAGMSRAELEETVMREWRQTLTCELPWPKPPACQSLVGKLWLDGSVVSLGARVDSSGAVVHVALASAGATARRGFADLAWRTAGRWDAIAPGEPPLERADAGSAFARRWATSDGRWAGTILLDASGAPVLIGSSDVEGERAMHAWMQRALRERSARQRARQR
jgi:hypothetical protein